LTSSKLEKHKISLVDQIGGITEQAVSRRKFDIPLFDNFPKEQSAIFEGSIKRDNRK